MLALPPVDPPRWWRFATRIARDHYIRVDTCDYSVHPLAIGKNRRSHRHSHPRRGGSRAPSAVLGQAADHRRPGPCLRRRPDLRPGPTAVVAIHGANLRCPGWRPFGCVGPTGSGKSSLLHVLSGLERLTSGSAAWPGIGGPRRHRPGLPANSLIPLDSLRTPRCPWCSLAGRTPRPPGQSPRPSAWSTRRPAARGDLRRPRPAGGRDPRPRTGPRLILADESAPRPSKSVIRFCRRQSEGVSSGCGGCAAVESRREPQNRRVGYALFLAALSRRQSAMRGQPQELLPA
ncbi:Mu transposase domain-containing protein [Streptomyces mirabilis]|uniref:Mu transposase domain-containing protein n=1 Tax=Streptomyces mirabilis TaxID=68239 RepID=UPI0036AE1B78